MSFLVYLVHGTVFFPLWNPNRLDQKASWFFSEQWIFPSSLWPQSSIFNSPDVFTLSAACGSPQVIAWHMDPFWLLLLLSPGVSLIFFSCILKTPGSQQLLSDSNSLSHFGSVNLNPSPN
jgi:hypothetical protein